MSAVPRPAWYALTVKHQHERPLAGLLEERGYEALVPLYRCRRRWSDRVKDLELPLFPGYVLCRFSHLEKARVLSAPGIARIVGFGGQPAEIPGGEIAAIQKAMESKLPARPWPGLAQGDRVRIERGPLTGIEGTLLREKDTRRKDGVFWFVLSVELLQRSIAVEVEADFVTPEQRRTCACPVQAQIRVPSAAHIGVGKK